MKTIKDHVLSFRQFFLVLPFLFLYALAGPLQAGTIPILNEGKKWRIAYYEGGPFSDYTDTMRTLIRGLIELGWIQSADVPVLEGDIPRPYWDWLTGVESGYLSFCTGNGYSAAWDEEKRAQIRAEILTKLRSGEIDLILAMGTWAGQDLSNNLHNVPTLVLSTSDPIRARIIKSAEDSGFDHVTARVDSGRYLRQIRMFHRIVRFKTLGVAYEDTPEGRIYSALDDIASIAEKRNFDVISCTVSDTTQQIEISDRSCTECYRYLAERADAVYLTALSCVDRQIEQLAELFISKKVPTFSMLGSKYVRKGLMMSISSDSGYQALGRYNARKLASILNGTSPRSLEQVFEDPLDIAVNTETVKRIGFKMPTGIMKVANEVYGDQGNP